MNSEEKTGGAQDKRARAALNVACSIDVDVPAVFYCSRCHKPFCEDCIGRETAAKTLCLHCAAVEDSQEDELQRASAFAVVKKKSFLLGFLGVLAAIGLTFNLYILYGDMQESDQSKVMEPVTDSQILGITRCRSNLEILAAEAASYYKAMERPPSSVEELAVILGKQVETTDPISSKPYIIESDGTGRITVHCPTPEAHGVSGIAATAGKPARVTYTNTAAQL